VDDADILLAEKEIARLEGIWVEPSSAAAVAAIPKLVDSGVLTKDETVVCVLTGSGLKDTEAARKFTPCALEVERNVEAILQALKQI
jgi:threonine synthase